MRLEVTPAELDATVGEPIVLQVEVYNSRSVIDGYRATLLGVPDQPYASEPAELSLFPETSGVILLTFTLPPTFPAGSRVIGVKVASVIDPEEMAAREVRVNVAPVSVATLAVEPLAVTAGKRAEFALTVSNQGNVPVETRLRASDSLGKLAFRLAPPTLLVDAGQTAVSRVLVGGRRPFFGSPIPHQLTFTAEGLPQPLQAASTFMQKPLIPRGVLTLVSILAALAVWGAVLFLGVNKVANVVKQNREAQAAAEMEAGAGPFAALPGGGGVLASVSGKVTATPDATDATVSLIPVPSTAGAAPPAGDIPAPVKTPASGEYKIDKVASPGVYQIVFAKVGLGTQSRLIDVKLGDQLTGVDVTLVAGSAAVSGTVSDAAGPVGGATVTADSGKNQVTTVTSSTGPVGTFALTGLPPATYVLSVAKEGFGTQTQVLDLAPNQKVTGLNITVSQGTGSISGTVSTKSGAPAADVLVTVRAGTGTVPSSIPPPTSVPPTPPLNPSDYGPDVLGAGLTLADGPVGFYSIGGLPTPGTFTVTFQKDGYLLATATASLPPNGNETALNPILQPVTGLVTGTVTQDIARAVPCAPLECRLPETQVKVTDRNGAEVRNTTTASNPADSAGRYEIAGLPPGGYTITFSKTGYVPQTFALALADNEPQHVLDVTLRGVTVTVSGSAPNCSAVDLVLRDGRALSPPVTASVRPDGSYRLTRVYSPGEYTVVFRLGSTVMNSTNLDLDAGETDALVDGFCTPPTTAGALQQIVGALTTTTTTATVPVG